MTQHNPNLSLNQQGNDVILLHSRLMDIGYTIATSEILNELFGESTYQAVVQFQQHEGLPPTGVVDAATAQALVNRFTSDKTVPRPAVSSQSPLTPHLATESASSPTAAPLQPLAGFSGTPERMPVQPPVEIVRDAPLPLPVQPAPHPIQPQPGVPVTLPPGSVVIPPPSPVVIPPVEVVPPAGVVVPPPPVRPGGGGGGVEPPPVRPGGGGGVEPPPVTSGGSNSLQGTIYLDHGLPANGLAVRLYNRGFGGVDTLLGETKTGGQGAYAFSYSSGGKIANLDVRVVGADGKEVSISAAQYNPPQQKVLNLVAPASVQPLAPEYQRLNNDLSAHLASSSKLGDAQEDSGRQDLTFLAQSTGWDPRLVSLAATANKLSATTNLGQDTLYALFRAGLPSDAQQLAWVDSATIPKALGATNKAGISNFTDQQLAAAQTAFDNFARPVRLATQSPGTASTFGQLLSKSNLAANEQTTFADLYFSHQGTGADLWQQAQAKGLAQEKLDTLRTQGKLAYLTLNNADLAASLQQETGSNLEQLVSKDFYKPETWKAHLTTLAGNDNQKMQALIPPTFNADNAQSADNLDAYAADLARKVRISYPTQVVGRMLANNELQINQGKENQSVQTFLQNATPLGFTLSQTHIDSFVGANQNAVFSGAAQAQIDSTVQSVKTLQRLYQITPTNESLKVMFDHGFTSAHDVVAFSPDDFIDRYAQFFPSLEEANLVYRKSQQITTVTYNFFSAAQQITATPPMFAVSASYERRQQARDTLIKQYPTLETLFGSLDFCECEHCHSVLSPAAYFVDLLQFLDPHANVWTSFLNDWKSKHNNAPYPFVDQISWTDFLKQWHITHPGAPDPDLQQAPYNVLIERRPDLPYLPLTCENTNTVMPYIDIVNEILEYFIAHGNLDQNAVHDTGNATTPELLAEPQNILPSAYDTLKKAHYPLSLPFDLWLETVRGFFNYYQMPFWQVLDIFRPSDELFIPQTNPKSYYRSAIFSEYLGITPSGYALFTGANPLTDWFTLYGYTAENDALAALPSAKTLSRRLGVSYKELIALMETSFVNPQLHTLGILYKLGVNAEDVFRYKGQAGYRPFTDAEKATFKKKLDDLSASFSSTTVGFDASAWLDSAWQNGDFNSILVFYDPNAEGNFDLTTLRYANGKAAENLVFLKINLFVRLWKRLGWSIEEVDRALQVFMPQHVSPLTGTNLGSAFTTALLYIAHLNTLAGQCNLGQNGRLQLLTFWSDLATTGNLPLYAQLFLKRSILQNDLVFDHPLGFYMTYFDTTTKQYQPFHWDSTKTEDPKTGNVSLKSHLSSAQAALSLSADEIGLILTDLGKTLDGEPLTLATLSLLYRYGLFAKALGLNVRDLIALKALSGLEPFKPLSLDPLTQLADDYPLTQTLRFVEIVVAVKGSNFTVEDLNYLLRHRFDPVGKYRPDPNAMLALVKTLAVGIRGIRSDNAIPTAASSLTDDFLRQKLALALPSDVVDTFFAMWGGTIAYTVTQNNVLLADKLNPADFAQESEIQVSYDSVRQAQQLTFRGVLFDAQRTQIETAHNSPVLAALLDQVQGQAASFFSSYLQPFLVVNDFTQLFTPLAAGLPDTDKQTQMQARRFQLAQAFLPYLQQKLTRQFVVSALATAFNADPTLTEAFLTDPSLLSDPTNPPAQAQPGNPLLDAFASSADRGVTATFFVSQDSSGAPSAAPSLVADVDTAVKPNGTNSVHFEGHIEVPTNGAYRFYIKLGKKDSNAELRLTALPDPLLRVTAGSDNSESSQFTELKAGIPYHFTFDVRVLGGGDASLLVQGENLPKGSLDRLTLYAQSAIDRVTRSWILMAKTLQFIESFGFSEVEVRYLLTHASDFAHLNLSKLPTQLTDDTPVGAAILFGQFLRLAEYANLKGTLAANTDDLVDLFGHARLSYPVTVNAAQRQATLFDDLCQRVANLTRRDVKTVKAVATALGFTTSVTPVGIDQILIAAPDFTQERGLQRLWSALQATGTLGVSMDELARWLQPAPDFAVARDLRNTVKAHYEPDTWQRIAQPIFDKLRQQQRNALVAYIMQQQGFDLPEQLFEYFLIDPGMESVVQTSRMVLAISSVQLFIQRCLLNLEKKVHPLAINAKQWQWMKRYRVWEANRKIFLFPENWLEPEFRDDKTNLFLDLESSLLQGDLSNDLAADAFFNYLKGLEVLARLDIVSMYCEEMPNPADNTLHVIGRSHNSPHKYFYRTFANQMWTPWVPVTIDIDGNHIVAVVWRQRLHLFWVTFVEKARQADTSSSTSNESYKARGDEPIAVNPKQVDMQLNWCEYFQGKWDGRQASDFGNLSDIGVESFDPASVYIYVIKEYINGEDGAVNIHLSDPIYKTFRVVNKNSQPQVNTFYSGVPYEPYSHNGINATRYTDSDTSNGELDISYTQSIEVSNMSNFPRVVNVNKAILQQGSDYALLFASNPPQSPILNEERRSLDWLGWFDSQFLIETLTRPFFYQDSENTFFVEPTMTETTIEEWDWWVIKYPWSNTHLNADQWWQNLVLQPSVPITFRVPPIEAIDPTALYQLKPVQDWVTNQSTVLRYGDHLVGQSGGLTIVKQPLSDRIGTLSTGIQLKPVAPGSISNIVNGGHVLNGGILHAGGGGLNLIDANGLTKGALKNVQFDQHMNGISRIAENINTR
ncbi:hypothetical protein KDH_11480 [Dictyobacter sp. S3.2.2.5]|uniref:PA14 domain-containing protein n=1 Tax=Dictyobacter halimunensis TaxID=3026934 RepID=A0ABQ6FJC2_9CHLR|nr:hypothetical protein KDH_11480 [Dictyobacter sp. S3.2.2.5]